MDFLREVELKKNYKRMFWIQALVNLKFFNLVTTLFYLQRGLNLSQVFFLSLSWSVVGLLFEIPSSYLADKWGRKKTIVFGSILGLLQYPVLIYAHGLNMFILSIILQAAQFACFSGTDEAIVYDTSKELKDENNSLSKLGYYNSAQKVFKIFTPFISALIVKDLAEMQFVLIIILDFFAALIAVFVSSKLIEPNHKMDVEKMEAGVMFDAYKLIKSNWLLVKSILNKTLIFFAIFAIWRFHQQYFVDLGVSILYIGIASSVFNLTAFFLLQKKINKNNDNKIEERINRWNYLFLIALMIFVIFSYIWPNFYLLLILFNLMCLAETIRWPMFSHIYNKYSHSYNRATTISLSNFLKSVLDIPLLLFSSFLIAIDQRLVFVFSAVLSIIVVVVLPLRKKK